jgi:hypothetical protein
MHSDAAIVFHVTRSDAKRCLNRTVIVKPSRIAHDDDHNASLGRRVDGGQQHGKEQDRRDDLGQFRESPGLHGLQDR